MPSATLCLNSNYDLYPEATMTEQWKHLNVIERAVALRVASLGLDLAVQDPDRTLRECILEWVNHIPEIIEEHCRGLTIDWNDMGHPYRGEVWGDRAIELLSHVVRHGEDIVSGDSSAQEARVLFWSQPLRATQNVSIPGSGSP
jgi:hypothetical protein